MASTELWIACERGNATADHRPQTSLRRRPPGGATHPRGAGEQGLELQTGEAVGDGGDAAVGRREEGVDEEDEEGTALRRRHRPEAPQGAQHQARLERGKRPERGNRLDRGTAHAKGLTGINSRYITIVFI